jgi:hypothetical protein
MYSVTVVFVISPVDDLESIILWSFILFGIIIKFGAIGERVIPVELPHLLVTLRDLEKAYITLFVILVFYLVSHSER